MILDQIIRERKKVVEGLKEKVDIGYFEKQIEQSDFKAYPFKAALENKEKPIQVIAEVKRASPSKGMIHAVFPYQEIARAYEKGGAAAISVLTEPHYFKGDNRYLTTLKKEVAVPLLRKDFIIDPIQIYEAKAIGADAILLIVAVLSPYVLQAYLKLSETLNLDCLVETHTKEEIEIALEAGAEIIGVNNRNLQNFEVRLETTEALRQQIPRDKIMVSESGIHTVEDARRLKRMQVDALLIGESMMRAPSPEEKLKAFIEA